MSAPLTGLLRRRITWSLVVIVVLALLAITFRQPLADRLWPEARAQRLREAAALALANDKLTAPDGSVDVRRITYNALSQPSRVEIGRGTPFDASQVTQYEYDELGRLIAERSGNAGNLVARYAYDANGRVTETANALGETTRLTYDALGRYVFVRATVDF